MSKHRSHRIGANRTVQHLFFKPLATRATPYDYFDLFVRAKSFLDITTALRKGEHQVIGPVATSSTTEPLHGI
jgi:hypothetical protein